MSQQVHFTASLLRRLAAALEGLSPDDLARLEDPATEIEVRIVRRRAKEVPTPETRVDLEEIIAKLEVLTSRADASSFLDSTVETRKGLEQVARHLDVAVQKQDKAETLRDKIIEATVGARLRSDAIKGSE